MRTLSIVKKYFLSAVQIIKIVVPLYILAELLSFLGWLKYISVIFEPITHLLNLPEEAAVVLLSGAILNIYAALSLASTLELNFQQATTIGTFVAICHSLPIEATVLRRLGVPVVQHVLLRIFIGVAGALVAGTVTAGQDQIVSDVSNTVSMASNLGEVFIESIYKSAYLCAQIIAIVIAVAMVTDFLKSRMFFKKFLTVHSYLPSLLVGGVLGVTYGASVLLAEKSNVQKHQMLYLSTFLLFAHGLFEESVIFALVGASVTIVFAVRLLFALGSVLTLYLALKVLKINVGFPKE